MADLRSSSSLATMHSNRHPPFSPPAGSNDREEPGSPESRKIVPLRRPAPENGADPDLSPEPAWRQAFAMGDGSFATRTPDRLMRARNGIPEPEPAPAPNRRARPRSTAPQTSVPEANSPAPESEAHVPLAPQEPPVRSQLAELRSQFAAEARDVSEPSDPLAQKESPLPQAALSLRTSEDHAQTQPAMETQAAPVQAFSINLAFASHTWLPSSLVPSSISFAKLIESAAPAPAPAQEATPVVAPVQETDTSSAPVSEPVVTADDLDCGYLSLYAAELTPAAPTAIAPAPQPVGPTAEKVSRPAPTRPVYTRKSAAKGKPAVAPSPDAVTEAPQPATPEPTVELAADQTPALQHEPDFTIEDTAEALPENPDEGEELPPFMTGEAEDGASEESVSAESTPALPALIAPLASYGAEESSSGPIVDLTMTGPATYGDPEAASAADQEWTYEFPDIDFLAEPPASDGTELTEDILEAAAGRLEKVIRDFGVKGEVVHVHPGPVVTLYEFVPAPGIKSSRVIALTEDIARSMSAISARVAVIPGRNVIGIELPNETRETVYLREILASEHFTASTHKMPLCLGKTIGGEPVIADLARMPHLLMAGTTGSGKSVAINTMILSLLYRFTPEQCRLIMVDPKMLELSVYDGIPHLLTPVVTDPKKAIIALRWAVREMEDRYKKMAKLGVRNIDGFNARVAEAREKGEVITRTVQTGFDKATGELTYAEEVMDLTSLPYIVVIVDEMADLMMVAGKEIEGAIQRLAQMARAAGIHVILATQRPSVDVITGTIKANFPTRISFQVTSKIDSRTILGEMGAEQLLGQGDMLHMSGGGRLERVHGPFCSDAEVEKVVAHLKRQAKPVYLEAVTADDEDEEEVDETPVAEEDEIDLDSGDLYDQAVSIVLRHKKASTSYIQRRLQIGYNRAASIMERMEKEGVVGPANHAGKREILIGQGGFDDD